MLRLHQAVTLYFLPCSRHLVLCVANAKLNMLTFANQHYSHIHICRYLVALRPVTETALFQEEGGAIFQIWYAWSTTT